MTTRREFLATGAAAGLAGLWSKEALAQPLPPKSPMGIGSASVTTLGTQGNPPSAIALIDHCRALGAGGLQFSPSGDLVAVRRRLEQLGMFVEGNARLPATLDEDTAAFEKSLLDAKAVGATVVRTVSRAPQGSSGRRYEFFKSYADYKAWETQANAILMKCVPIAERLGVKLALENHKDRVVDDHVALLARVSSEHLGALVDPGNNVAMMETPEETCTKLAPYVLACSLKDMGVVPYADGFLLSEVVFGTGATDQLALFNILRAGNPRINPIEELITRDPLKIPCLTPGYWASYAEGRKAARLNRIMDWVKSSATALPYVTGLTPAQLAAVEAENHRKTMEWARVHLA